jgi:hypothetical protein
MLKTTVDLLDFISNGFKCRRNHTNQNESGKHTSTWHLQVNLLLLLLGFRVRLDNE